MHPLPRALFTTAALGTASLAWPAAGQEPVPVVVSIKPLHSLVAGVMAGVGEPGLILSGGDSEHTYSLKPSEAAALQEAEVVFWIGEGLETFLTDTLASVAGDAHVVALGETEGLLRLPVRTGATWEAHDHADDHDDEHAHEDEHAHDDEHAHEDEHAHAEEEVEAGHDDEHAEDHGHAEEGQDHGGFDPHVWLDPANAQALVTAIADTLAEADPAHADAYRANAATTVDALAALDAEIAALLAPVADRPFVVFHDGYQYLESHYGLAGVGAITVSPEVQPGAARLQQVRDRIAALGAVCVFAEPQFTPALIETVVEGTQARVAVLDTLGAELDNGPELYFQLMRGNAQALADCLGGG